MENKKENYYKEYNHKHSKSYNESCNNNYGKNKIYNKLSDSLKEKFGEKVLKICVDGHFSCPNRDGTLSKTGCIYCSAKGSGELIGKFKTDTTNFGKTSEHGNNKNTNNDNNNGNDNNNTKTTNNNYNNSNNSNTTNNTSDSILNSSKNIIENKESKYFYHQYGFITEQVKNYLNSYRVTRANKFIVYFQNFTNTYDTIENLKKRYDAALIDDRIVGIDIATRPDCISNEICELLASYKEKYDVTVELGLQTSSDEIGKKINRCYSDSDFINSVKLLRKYNINVCVHIMLGLPYEDRHKYFEYSKNLNLALKKANTRNLYSKCNESKNKNLKQKNDEQVAKISELKTTELETSELKDKSSDFKNISALNKLTSVSEICYYFDSKKVLELASEELIETINFINQLDLQGIKIHSTYVVKDTSLEALYNQKQYQPLDIIEYLYYLVYAITHLKPETIVHRIVGDAPKDILIAPEWNAHKKLVMNCFEKIMKENNLYQGIDYRNSSNSLDFSSKKV